MEHTFQWQRAPAHHQSQASKVPLNLLLKYFLVFRKIAARQVWRSVSGNLSWRKNCRSRTCLWPWRSPRPLHGNMCCLGRYKGVILLLGTSLLRSHFIFFPFSLHRSLYLISYSAVWLPQTGPTLFSFGKHILACEGWQTMGALKGLRQGSPSCREPFFPTIWSLGAELSLLYTSGKISSSVSCWQILSFV